MQPPARAAEEAAQQRTDRRLVEPSAARSRRLSWNAHPRMPHAETPRSAHPLRTDIYQYKYVCRAFIAPRGRY
jgi:hypothetical protein